MESMETLRELADDMNCYEIIDHVHIHPRLMLDGEWLDSWHKAFDKACSDIEAEVAEKYMLLPVDADGVTIHVGDMIEYGCNGERLEVTHIGLTKHGDPTVAYRRPNGTLDASCIGSECRHYKPRTLEDVLYECFHDCMYKYPFGIEPIISKYVAEIREMLGVE